MIRPNGERMKLGSKGFRSEIAAKNCQCFSRRIKDGLMGVFFGLCTKMPFNRTDASSSRVKTCFSHCHHRSSWEFQEFVFFLCSSSKRTYFSDSFPDIFSFIQSKYFWIVYPRMLLWNKKPTMECWLFEMYKKNVLNTHRK